jgi:3',5'-cyclic AMP phosphodiesterase CpdA
MSRGGSQLAWLEEQLSGAERDGLRVVVMLHLPPFSSGQEEGPAPWVRERVVEEVLDRHPVALVLSGHVHAYERIQRPGHDGRPVTYLVSGGAGGRFFHAVENREPGSVIFVEEARHFVLLQLGPEGIAGEMIPVEVPGVGAAPVGADRFTVDLR